MLFIICVTVLVIVLIRELYWKRRNLPPGPIPIPIFGNTLELKRSPPGYEPFVRWSKKYGNVFTFWMGSEPFVVFTSYEKMKETFVRDGDTYVDKKPNRALQSLRSGNWGVIDTNGEVWRDHRRFALTQLRDLGFGKDLMQMKIIIEVEELFKEIDSTHGAEVDLPKMIDRAVGNVINQTLFGYRFGNDRAEEFVELKGLIDSIRLVVSKFRNFIQIMVPMLSKIMPGETLADAIREKRDGLQAFFMRQIVEHKAVINYDDEENSDYVEGYLKEQKKREADGDHDSFSDSQLGGMCFDMWLAGLVTTTMTMTWGIAYYMNDPEVKRKINEELDRVIGSDRLITTTDKNSLPYMNAFINETQRCANIIPLNLQHQTTRDTTVDGYFIKKGTGVIAQVATIMWDEQLFPEPEKFNPDRFIENGKLKKVEELLPFSIGKRQCLGEGLARMELYLFFANLFNRYDILEASTGKPSLDKSGSSAVMEREFDAIMKTRKT